MATSLEQVLELLIDLPNIQIQDAFEDKSGHPEHEKFIRRVI
jgi:hypothetical protein